MTYMRKSLRSQVLKYCSILTPEVPLRASPHVTRDFPWGKWWPVTVLAHRWRQGSSLKLKKLQLLLFCIGIVNLYFLLNSAASET